MMGKVATAGHPGLWHAEGTVRTGRGSAAWSSAENKAQGVPIKVARKGEKKKKNNTAWAFLNIPFWFDDQRGKLNQEHT